MNLVKLTNGTRERPALYVGLYRPAAQHLFGEAASDHSLYRAVSRQRLYLAVGLIDRRIVMRPARTLTDPVGDGWVVVEVRPIGSSYRRIPKANATVACFTIYPGQLPGLIVEGRLGVQTNPRRPGTRQALRNPRVAVHGRNEFDHPVRLARADHVSAQEASFDLPPNWLEENGAHTSFQPALPFSAGPREEALAAQLSDAMRAPEPSAEADPARAEATPGFYTVRVSPQVIENMLVAAVLSGRSVLVDKTTGWVEVS